MSMVQPSQSPEPASGIQLHSFGLWFSICWKHSKAVRGGAPVEFPPLELP